MWRVIKNMYDITECCFILEGGNSNHVVYRSGSSTGLYYIRMSPILFSNELLVGVEDRE